MYEIQVWLVLASATSEFHKIQIFYHNISCFTIHTSRFFHAGENSRVFGSTDLILA
jgi:hypothetical protein